jgi:8-oxo-dGTP diphosphatase
MVAAAALIDEDRRVLIQQRPPGGSMAGLWEFPGGKIESGETPEAALTRELHEELGIEVRDFAPLAFASAALGERHLLMLLYGCRRWDGTPMAIHASGLRWLAPEKLPTIEMPPADLPLIASVVTFAQDVGE